MIIYDRIYKKKDLGEFLQNCMIESKSVESQISESDNQISFQFKNEKGQSLVVDITLYKTGWKVSFNSECYESKIFGIIDKSISVNSGKKLNQFLNSVKYSKIKSNDVNLGTSINVLEKIADESIELAKHNIECTSGFFDLNLIIKHITSTIFEFKIDTSVMEVFNLFKLFYHVKESSINSFIKDLVLYVIAKNIFKKKYEILDSPLTSIDRSFEIQATSNPICYAHALQFYGGKCKYLHGHNGKLVIRANVSPNTINKRPMFLSYGFMKGFLKYMDKKLDHKTFWALNKENKLVKSIHGDITFKTPKQTVIFHDDEALTIFQYLEDSKPFSTSEVTLYNYVIPHFLIFLINFIIEDEGPDSTGMAFYDISELIRFTFQWYETDSTVCSVCIDC